jgi:hypothetical protein
MSTSPVPLGRVTVLDRISNWALDTSGPTYGDERERLRWYEGIATAAMIQWIAMPWAAAVLVWVGGRPVAPALMVMMAVLYLPMLLCSGYVSRRRVNVNNIRWTTRARVNVVLAGVPYLLFILGLARAYQVLNGSLGWEIPVGAALGAGAAAVGVRLQARRRQQRETAAEDLD